jgi:hypothetical protein
MRSKPSCASASRAFASLSCDSAAAPRAFCSVSVKRTISAPFSTWSPTSTGISSTRPLVCAETVDWFTASTTPSKSVSRGTVATATAAVSRLAEAAPAPAAGGVSESVQPTSTSASSISAAGPRRGRRIEGGDTGSIRNVMSVFPVCSDASVAPPAFYNAERARPARNRRKP